MTGFRTLCVIFLLSGFKWCNSQLDDCGIAPLNTKIVGGQTAVTGSWPWQVSLQNSVGHFCGGTLINNLWVLSAAHCFSKYAATDVVLVVLSLQNLTGTDSDKVSASVLKVIKHPNYNSITNNNDLALLQLSKPVNFTNRIRPVCLAAGGSTVFTNYQTWVTGWGNIRTDVLLPFPGRLQEVEIPIIGNRHCTCLYANDFQITSNMICAGPLEGGKDSCQGDSGGPLVIKQGSRWIQIGIVSFGKGCAQSNFPGVYTRVSEYQSWISNYISTNQPGFLKFTSEGTDADLAVSCNILSQITTTTAPTTTPPPVVCGKAKLQTSSGLSSSLARQGNWPWMASLQRNGSHICGGTLIAEQFVLSSADCFSNSTNTSNWTVILGRLKQQGSNSNEASVKVLKITFSSKTSNNVAILQLSTKPTLSDYIQPICMDFGSNNFTSNTQCWSAGWGSGGGAEQTLLQFSSTIVGCVNSTVDSICTIAMPLEQSHRGGALMCKINEAWVHAAVLTVPQSTSSSSKSALSRASIIQTFTKVSSFTTFLKSTVGTFPKSSSSNVAFSVFTLLILLISSRYLI